MFDLLIEPFPEGERSVIFFLRFFSKVVSDVRAVYRTLIGKLQLLSVNGMNIFM